MLFKINSVINAFNVNEDMSENISQLKPVRWKIFQCLPIEGENIGEHSLRKVDPFLITNEQFKDFISRHAHVSQMVPEYSEMMKQSYFIVDEYFRFLDNSSGRMKPSESILEVGVDQAMQQSGFKQKKYLERGGRYDWTKPTVCQNPDLDW